MTRQSQQQGAAFEQTLELLHKAYLAEGLARVRHNGLMAVKAYDSNHRLKTLAKKSAPDYTGHLIPTGRRVEFDAKAITGTYYYHHAERYHQLRELWEIQATGGIGFLLIYLLDADRAYMIPARPTWAEMGSWSVQLADGKRPKFARPVPSAKWYPNDYVPDWRAAIFMETDLWA